jgi:hypothetical protein
VAPTPRVRTLLWRSISIALATAVFALAYTQYPLYDGNYATYLLHGLASGGLGSLRDDWTAGTADPFPVVSVIACVTHRLGHPALYHVYHAGLLGVFLIGTLLIVSQIHGFKASGAKGAAFVALAILVHSAMFRALVRAATGGDWGWYLQGGLAQQYLLGFVFQPSLFGVLAVASIAAFLRGRDALAVTLAALAVYAHFSYCLMVAGLVGAYGVVRFREAQGAGKKAALRSWLLGVAALSPVMIFTLARFGPTDAHTFARAQAILVDLRIPHHAQPQRWVHPSMWIQVPLVAAAMLVARRSRLAVVLLVLTAVAAALTLAQLATHSRALALLFPWRISVLLVPLSTAVLLGRAVAAIPLGGAGERALAGLGSLAALTAAVYGVLSMRRAFRAYHGDDPALAMMLYVKSKRTDADLYVIPTDLQRFRIHTGARTFVDWKAHPYLDREVIEWHERIEAARGIERAEGEVLCQRAAELARQHGVTHFVVPSKKPVHCKGLLVQYRDDHFSVFRASQHP